MGRASQRRGRGGDSPRRRRQGFPLLSGGCVGQRRRWRLREAVRDGAGRQEAEVSRLSNVVPWSALFGSSFSNSAHLSTRSATARLDLRAHREPAAEAPFASLLPFRLVVANPAAIDCLWFAPFRPFSRYFSAFSCTSPLFAVSVPLLCTSSF